MKSVLLFLSLSLFPLSSTFAVEKDRSCKQLMSDAKELLGNIRGSMKDGKDIDEDFDSLEGLTKEHPKCVSFKKLNLSNNQVAGFRKYTFAPDRSFNLKKKDCAEFKVDTTNMPKNNNQGPLGWCFAFSAADILSFHEKTRLSAYDIAINHHDYAHKEDMSSPEKDMTDVGGTSFYAILFATNSDKGICLESDVNYTAGDWEKLSDMIKNLGTPGKNLSEIICENQFGEKEAFANLSQDVINALNKMTAAKRVEGVLDVECKDRHKFSRKYGVIQMTTTDPNAQYTQENIVEELDKVLAKGAPVTIGYASDLLSSGVNFHGKPDHESTLIGRKFNPESGQCEYLIKNSWGDSDCPEITSIKCEDGNFWVPRTALKNNIDSASWIKAD